MCAVWYFVQYIGPQKGKAHDRDTAVPIVVVVCPGGVPGDADGPAATVSGAQIWKRIICCIHWAANVGCGSATVEMTHCRLLKHLSPR